MKVGLMGGTFDPIHLGHLIAAEAAREGAGLDEVWFMPANVPPHKTHPSMASGEHRLEMVARAVDSHPCFRPLDFELARSGTSYTVDTVVLLRSAYPEHRFYFIIGADMVMYLPNWHRIEELIANISFIGLQRPGYALEPESLPATIRAAVTLVQMTAIEVSSTDIRQRRRSGRSIRYFVPEPVRTFIEENRLYES